MSAFNKATVGNLWQMVFRIRQFEKEKYWKTEDEPDKPTKENPSSLKVNLRNILVEQLFLSQLHLFSVVTPPMYLSMGDYPLDQIFVKQPIKTSDILCTVIWPDIAQKMNIQRIKESIRSRVKEWRILGQKFNSLETTYVVN